MSLHMHAAVTRICMWATASRARGWPNPYAPRAFSAFAAGAEIRKQPAIPRQFQRQCLLPWQPTARGYIFSNAIY